MKQCTISSTTELSFIFTALIWDSNVSDMKFGWLGLFASRMSSYLNVLFTRWLQVDTLDGAGPIKAWSVSCLLFNWGFVDCSVRSSVLGSCMGVLTCTLFIHNKVLSIISALFFNPNLGFLPGSIWIWKKYQNLVFQVLCHLACSCGDLSVAIIFFYLVMKSWETFFMLNFIYFHFQIAIVEVLHEIRLLSGKSFWKYGCKWRCLLDLWIGVWILESFES